MLARQLVDNNSAMQFLRGNGPADEVRMRMEYGCGWSADADGVRMECGWSADGVRYARAMQGHGDLNDFGRPPYGIASVRQATTLRISSILVNTICVVEAARPIYCGINPSINPSINTTTSHSLFAS
jgi:hypothetical protein